MLILDRMLMGGVSFVLDQIANAADAELNNEDLYREQLLAAQLQVEQGEMTPEAFAALEAEVMLRLREIRERKEGGPRSPLELKVTGAEVTLGGDDEP